MITRHLEVTEVNPIPHTFDRYQIDKSLIIRLTSNDSPVQPDADGNYCIATTLGRVSKPLRWWVALTFKPVFRIGQWVLDWDVMYADEGSGDHPANLIWCSPKGPTPCIDNPGFYIVPNFSRLSVSLDGQAWNRHYRRPSGIRKSPQGYLQASTTDQSGKAATVGVHRLMGLALLPFDNRVNRMTVNHRDGNKTNSVVDLTALDDATKTNLEWTTYGENNRHAMDNYLRDVRKPVAIKDLHDGTVVHYPSLSHAAEFLGRNSGTLHVHLENRKTPIFKFKYCVKYQSAGTWPDVDLEWLKVHEEQSKQLGVAAYNTIDKKMIVADGFKALSLEIGIEPYMIRHSVRTGRCWHLTGGWHVFSYRHTALFMANWDKVKAANPDKEYLEKADVVSIRSEISVENSALQPVKAGDNSSNCWELLVY